LQAQTEELRVTNEALQESEKRFRTLAENSPDIIARFDRQNRHTYVNPAAAKVYGLSQEEIIGKTYSELRRDPEQVRFLETYYEIVFATGKTETIDFQYTSPQGKEYYFNTKIVPEFANGKVNSILTISHDITSIKEAETKLKETLDNLDKLVKERTANLEKAYNLLRESEKGLAEAQEMAHLGNWDWNIVTNGLYWSDEIYRIFGCNPKEFGATYDAFLSYVHPDDRDYVNNAVIEASKGKSYSIDHRIILANGEERIVHEQGEVAFDENNVPIRMKGTVQDITERKQMESALESLARLPQENPNPVMRLTQGRIINYSNPSAQVLLTDWSSAIGQEAPAEITELAVEALNDGVRVKLECSYADRTYIIDLAPFPQAGYINLYASDITERKKAQEALEKIEKIRIKEIHHRIKNNLQVVSSLLDLQAEKFEEENVVEAFREGQNRVVSMALIHEELYNGEGKDKLDFSVYLKKLAKSLFKTYSLQSDSIHLSMDLEDDAFLDMDTAVPLGIIVNELVSNSLKHAFPGRNKGEIRIKFSREESSEFENCRAVSNSDDSGSTSYTLSVSDDGVGIPENLEIEDLDTLGFQLVTTLVDQLDGELELKRNNGTEFTIRFAVTEKNNHV
jgi:PAS domain S-box-containing protein